jgi:hypothetical protein
MAPTGQQLHAGTKRRLGSDLWKYAPANANDRIGSEHEGIWLPARNRLRLFAGKP